MKTKNISYILFASLFTISGCGSQSSSSDPSSVESLQEAIYLIPKENISNNSYKTQPITSGSRNSYKVTNTNTLEDAEDGTTNGWRSYDRSPKSVVISNLYDNSKKSKVIDLKGVGTKNGAYFSLQSNSTANTIKWNMNFNEDYTIYVRLNTKNGNRYIYYTSANNNYGKASAPYDYYIHHGLGSTSNNGTWQTFSRDLSQDLEEFEPNNTINSIEGLYIRGSGRIDDIALLKTQIDSECIGYHNLRNKINNNEDVRNADISCITDMSGIFTNNKTFNQDISSWDTSNVTNMAWMFNRASAFNQDISSWDTSKVTSTQGMFNHTYSFNQNINAWDVSNVTNMDYMFNHAEAFEQDLSLWQVDKVQSHKGFSYATASGTIEPNWADLYPYDIRAIDRGFEIYDTSSPSNPILVTTHHLFPEDNYGGIWGHTSVDNITLLEDKQNILIGVKEYRTYYYYIVDISDIHNPITIKKTLTVGSEFRQSGVPVNILHMTDNKYLLYNNSAAYFYNFDTYRVQQSLSFTQYGVTFLSKDKKLLLEEYHPEIGGPPIISGLTIYDISNLDNITSKKYPLDRVVKDGKKIKITEDDGTQTIIELL